MNTKHTPAPWKVGQAFIEEANHKALIVENNEGAIVCLVSPMEEADHKDMENANLIAAAPDLLEALKGLLHVPMNPVYEPDYEAMKKSL